MMIIEKYGFDDVETKPIKKGTDSDAVLVCNGDDRYILRRLKNAIQADLEYCVSSSLKGKDVVPEILVTTDGAHCVEYNGSLFNLQKYIEGNAVCKVDEALVRTIAKQVAIMHKVLSSYQASKDERDRFSLKEAIALSQGKQGQLIASLNRKNVNSAELEKWCKKLIALDEQKKQLILGDLGFWNMLQSGEKVYMIDFGECRMGSVYFDVAAVMASALSKSSVEHFLQKVYYIFAETYSEYNAVLDCREVFQYMILWYVRGIYAVILNEKNESNQEKAIAYYLKEIEKCEKAFSLIDDK